MTLNDPLGDLVIGYPKLAGQMEIQPESAIFRRFGALNARNLMYMQAELIYLEQDLQKLERLDSRNKGGQKGKYAVSWYWLSQSNDDGDTQQLDLVLRIRERLKEYNEALIQQRKLVTTTAPGKWDLNNLQDFLGTKQMNGCGTYPFLGEDAQTWGSSMDRESHAPDLVALCPRAKTDLFSGWLAKTVADLVSQCGFNRFKKPSRVHGVVGFGDKAILHISYGIATLLASLVPISSILVLYNLPSMKSRLSIIAGFNILLSICMIGFTNARRVEVFGVSAAYICRCSSGIYRNPNECAKLRARGLFYMNMQERIPSTGMAGRGPGEGNMSLVYRTA